MLHKWTWLKYSCKQCFCRGQTLNVIQWTVQLHSGKTDWCVCVWVCVSVGGGSWFCFQNWIFSSVCFSFLMTWASHRTQPPTQRLLSLSAPWPIRSTVWCVHVVMPIRISPPFSSSCVRRRRASDVSLYPVHSLVVCLALHRTNTV